MAGLRVAAVGRYGARRIRLRSGLESSPIRDFVKTPLVIFFDHSVDFLLAQRARAGFRMPNQNSAFTHKAACRLGRCDFRITGRFHGVSYHKVCC
jgi:hypothetical protein